MIPSRTRDGGSGGVPVTIIVPNPDADTGTATGGAVATTPPPDCTGVQCKKLSCPDNSVPFVPDGECCPSCGPDCSGTRCADPHCRIPNAAVTPLGQCCPICLPLPSSSAPGRTCDPTVFLALEQAMIDKYASLSCTQDSDCNLVGFNMCGHAECGISVSVSATTTLVGNLSTYAWTNCDGCGYAESSCPFRGAAMCVDGVCK
jgi:hypothetical protein